MEGVDCGTDNSKKGGDSMNGLTQEVRIANPCPCQDCNEDNNCTGCKTYDDWFDGCKGMAIENWPDY